MVLEEILFQYNHYFRSRLRPDLPPTSDLCAVAILPILKSKSLPDQIMLITQVVSPVLHLAVLPALHLVPRVGREGSRPWHAGGGCRQVVTMQQTMG